MAVEFAAEGWFPFPSLHQGSSSGLGMLRTQEEHALLFVTQQPGSEQLYLLDPHDGSVLRSFDPERNDTIGAVAFDGSNLRVANVMPASGSFPGMINTISMTGPDEGEEIGSIPAPHGRGEGLTYADGALIYSTVTEIHEIDAGNGALLRSYPTPRDGRCMALEVVGPDRLAMGDAVTEEIVVFRRSSLEVEGAVPAPGRGLGRVHGLAYDAGRLFVANQHEQRIYHGPLTVGGAR